MISKEKIGEVIKVLSIHGAQVFFDKETGLFRVYLTEYLKEARPVCLCIEGGRHR